MFKINYKILCFGLWQVVNIGAMEYQSNKIENTAEEKLNNLDQQLFDEINSEKFGKINWDKVLRLIKNGANVHLKNKLAGNTAIMLTCLANDDYLDPRVIDFLVDYGANPNEKMHNGSTPLIMASLLGNKNAVIGFIRNGADLNAVDREGKTALWWAIKYMNQEIMKLLVLEGAETKNTRLKRKYTGSKFSMAKHKKATGNFDYLDRLPEDIIKYIIKIIMETSSYEEDVIETLKSLKATSKKYYELTKKIDLDVDIKKTLTKLKPFYELNKKLAEELCYQFSTVWNSVLQLINNGADVNLIVKNKNTSPRSTVSALH